jgi:hypothetical protein
MQPVLLIAGSVLNTGRNENEGAGRKKGYLSMSFCDLNHILRFIVK